MAEILEQLTLVLIPLFLVADLVHRARRFRPPRFWRLRGLIVTVVAFGLSIGVTLFWGALVGERTLLDLSGLGMVGGALVGIVVYELVHYWYHRTAHRWDLVWRSAHQMHHSAESLDAWGAYYLHPLDVIFFTSWSSLVLFPLLGLSLEAGALAACFLTFNAMFQHANVRTPRWVGYFIQRPEMHGIHHQRGVHAYNYADLALWDMVFGTWRNPEVWEDEECGFYQGASSRIGAMLIGRDVSAPPADDVGGADTESVTRGTRWAEASTRG